MTDWLKEMQSKGRGFMPGMEITVLKSRQQGKSVILDLKSDFTNWTHVLQPHYVEMWDEDGVVLSWFRFDKKPYLTIMYEASRIIRCNEDGSFEYIKNRKDGSLGPVSEKEMIWIMLTAQRSATC